MKEWKAVTEPLGRLAARMKGDKRIELAVYVLLAALGILVYTASCGKEAEEPAQAGMVEAPAETAVEERLEETLSCIRGAGKVQVMITYDTGAQVVPAYRGTKQYPRKRRHRDRHRQRKPYGGIRPRHPQ